MILYDELLAIGQEQPDRHRTVITLWNWLHEHLNDQSLLPHAITDFSQRVKARVNQKLNRSKASMESRNKSDPKLLKLCEDCYEHLSICSTSSRANFFSQAFDVIPAWLIDEYDIWLRRGEPDLEYLRQTQSGASKAEGENMGSKDHGLVKQIMRRLKGA